MWVTKKKRDKRTKESRHNRALLRKRSFVLFASLFFEGAPTRGCAASLEEPISLKHGSCGVARDVVDDWLLTVDVGSG